MSPGSGTSTARVRSLPRPSRRYPMRSGMPASHTMRAASKEFGSRIAPSNRSARKPAANLVGLAVLPLENGAVKIDRNEYQHLLSSVFHQLLFFGERFPNFVVHPPALQ